MVIRVLLVASGRYGVVGRTAVLPTTPGATNSTRITIYQTRTNSLDPPEDGPVKSETL